MQPAILVIDDDALSQKCCTVALEGAHYAVTATPSLNIATTYLLSHSFALIVLDLCIPTMRHGLDFATDVRRWIPCPLLIVSRADEERAALQAGGTAFLPKPIRPATLLTTVATLLTTAASPPMS